jgi:hypothetical protein
VTHSPKNLGAFAAPNHVVLSTMQPSDDARVQALHEQVFGPGRYARTAFRLREKAAPLLSLSLVANEEGTLIGAVSMSRIAVGENHGVLLGPLAVFQRSVTLASAKRCWPRVSLPPLRPANRSSCWSETCPTMRLQGSRWCPMGGCTCPAQSTRPGF